jgi:hypothetical protein
LRLESVPAPVDRTGTALSPTVMSDELRAVLARTEDRVDLLRGTAAELNAVLPTRIEAAVARALGTADDTTARGLTELGEQCERIAGTVGTVADDLLAERLSRAEDLEVLVDLVRSATVGVKADVQALERRLADLGAMVAGLAVTVRALGPAVAAVSSKLDRPLSVTVDARPAEQPPAAAVPPPGGYFPPGPRPLLSHCVCRARAGVRLRHACATSRGRP